MERNYEPKPGDHLSPVPAFYEDDDVIDERNERLIHGESIFDDLYSHEDSFPIYYEEQVDSTRRLPESTLVEKGQFDYLNESSEYGIEEDVEDAQETNQKENIESATETRGRKKKPKTDAHFSEYSDIDLEYFISLVEIREELWDPTNKSFHRDRENLLIWNDLEKKCQRFMAHTNRTVGQCAKKLWKQLMEEYKRNQKKIQKAPSGSGRDATKITFRQYDLMNFVDSATKARETRITHCFGSQKFSVSTPRSTTADTTPKRPSTSSLPLSQLKKRRTDDSMRCVTEEMAKTREVVMRLLSPETKESTCSSATICRMFAEASKGKSWIETTEMESKVVSFICSLRDTESSRK